MKLNDDLVREICALNLSHSTGAFEACGLLRQGRLSDSFQGSFFPEPPRPQDNGFPWFQSGAKWISSGIMYCTCTFLIVSFELGFPVGSPLESRKEGYPQERHTQSMKKDLNRFVPQRLAPTSLRDLTPPVPA